MAITTKWTDNTHTILYCYFEGRWDWNNFHQAVGNGCRMIANAKHDVHVVIDALHCAGMPQNSPFPHFKQAISQLPQNTSTIMIITRQRFVKMSVAIAVKFFKMEDRFFIVPSVEEARAILAEQTAKQHLKNQLIEQFVSGEHQNALDAIEQLRFHEWLMDGSLWGIDLSGADLHQANLFLADLGSASLEQVNLNQSNLFMVNLEDAMLWRARFCGASLVEANFYNANLKEANFHQADLSASNLQRSNLKDTNFGGANLMNAKFYETNLHHARFDHHTILPDGSYWTPNIDLSIFTDPHHRQFWYAQQQREDETIPNRPLSWHFDDNNTS